MFKCVMKVEGGRGEGKSRERTMPRRAELSEPFSLTFTGEEGGSAPAPPRGEAFPVGDQRRPEHAAVGEQHQLVWLRGRPAPRPRASPTTDPPKPWLWNAGDGEERRGSWPQPGLGQIGSMWHSSDLQLPRPIQPGDSGGFEVAPNTWLPYACVPRSTSTHHGPRCAAVAPHSVARVKPVSHPRPTAHHSITA